MLLSFQSSFPLHSLIHFSVAEFRFKQRPREEDQQSLATDYSDFDASRHHPVFYGGMHYHIPTDFDEDSEFDPAVSHPACVGYAFTDKPPKPPTPPGPPPPDKDKCECCLQKA